MTSADAATLAPICSARSATQNYTVADAASYVPPSQEARRLSVYLGNISESELRWRVFTHQHVVYQTTPSPANGSAELPFATMSRLCPSSEAKLSASHAIAILERHHTKFDPYTLAWTFVAFRDVVAGMQTRALVPDWWYRRQVAGFEDFVRPRKMAAVASKPTSDDTHMPCRERDADVRTTSYVEPFYPDAENQGDVAEAEMKVTLGADGRTVDISTYRSSGDARFDAAAHAAAASSKYAPEIVNCRATAGSYLYTADFVHPPDSTEP